MFHTRPMGENYLDIAPVVAYLRQHVTLLAGRPGDVQASRDWVIGALRGDRLASWYLNLFFSAEAGKAAGGPHALRRRRC